MIGFFLKKPQAASTKLGKAPGLLTKESIKGGDTGDVTEIHKGPVHRLLIQIIRSQVP